MGSPPDWLSVESTDEILYSGNPSAYILVPEGMITVVVSAITSFVIAQGPLADMTLFGQSIQMYLLAMLLLSLLLVGYMEIRRRFTRYIVTSQGIYKKTGIIGRDPDYLPIRNLQGLDWSQGPFERVLGIGEIVFASASSGTMRSMKWTFVPNPEDVNGEIEDQLAGMFSHKTATESKVQAESANDDGGETSGGILQRLSSSNRSAVRSKEGDDSQDGEDSTEPEQATGEESNSTPPGFH